jgi:zinc D-Ala-D-Ala dipeptidase
MTGKYDFRIESGFPNLLVRPNSLPEATLSELEVATKSEYARLAGLGKAAAADYSTYTKNLPPLDNSILLASPLVEIIDNGNLKVEKVYWEAGLLYSVEQTLVRVEVLRRLKNAANRLPEGFRLVVLDAWRSYKSQEHLYRTYYSGGSKLEEGFVSPPSLDPRTPSPHTTGGTVDVTLSFNGIPLGLGTGYDEFSERAFAMTDSILKSDDGITELEWELRRILYYAMYESDFVVLPEEWWHFEYGTRLWAATKSKQSLFGRIERDGKLYTGESNIESENVDTQILVQSEETTL